MIQVKPVSEATPWDELTDYSKMELAMFPADQLANLDLIELWYEGSLVLIGGFIRRSLLGAPHLMLLLAKGFRPRPTMFAHLFAYLDKAVPMCETLVQDGYRAGERLARWWGFVPTEQQFQFSTVQYRVYRRSTKWLS